MFPKCRSQYLSTYDANLGGVFLPLGQGDSCARLDWMDLEKRKKKCTCCLLHEKGEISQNDLMRPLQLWVWRTSSKFVHKSKSFGSDSFFIHITYYDKVANFLNFLAWLKWSQKKIKKSYMTYINPQTISRNKPFRQVK